MKKTIAIHLNAVIGSSYLRGMEALYIQIIRDFRRKFGFWPVAGDKIEMLSPEFTEEGKYEVYLMVTDRFCYPASEPPLISFSVDIRKEEIEEEDEGASFSFGGGNDDDDGDDYDYDYKNRPGSDD